MKMSYWGYGLILIGVGIIVALILIFNYTSTNESDYYNLKETTEAAMLNSVNYEKWINDGVLEIDKQQFMAEFIRRFAENTRNNKNYKISFYDIYENPPKVSISITSSTGNTLNFSTDTAIVNKLSGILEIQSKKSASNNSSSEKNFTINGQTYKFINSTTWNFWIQTSYNTLKCGLEDKNPADGKTTYNQNNVLIKCNGGCLAYGSTCVKSTDSIVERRNYTIKSSY